MTSDKNLRTLVKQLEGGEVPNFFELMSAIGEIADFVQRPETSADLDKPLTTCQIYRGHACGD